MEPSEKNVVQRLSVLAACMCLGLPMTKSYADTDTFWVLDPAVVHKLEVRIVMPESSPSFFHISAP
jgi:hypothetical protein